MKPINYLNAGILTTTVDGLQSRRIGHSKNVTNVMVGMYGVKAVEGPRGPNLRLVNTADA